MSAESELAMLIRAAIGAAFVSVASRGLEIAFIRVNKVNKVSSSYYLILASLNLSGTGSASFNIINIGLSLHFLQSPLTGLITLGNVAPGNR